MKIAEEFRGKYRSFNTTYICSTEQVSENNFVHDDKVDHSCAAGSIDRPEVSQPDIKHLKKEMLV